MSREDAPGGQLPGERGDIPNPICFNLFRVDVVSASEGLVLVPGNQRRHKPSFGACFCLRPQLQLCVISCLLILSALLLWLLLTERLTDSMRQATSKPLDLVLAHFKKARTRAHNFSVDMRKGKMMTFCSSEWPTFDVGWPPSTSPPSSRRRIGSFRKCMVTQIRYHILLSGRTLVKPFLTPIDDPPSTSSLKLEAAAPVTETKTDPKGVLSAPSDPLHPVLQDGTPKEVIFPPHPYRPPKPSCSPACSTSTSPIIQARTAIWPSARDPELLGSLSLWGTRGRFYSPSLTGHGTTRC